LFEREKEKETLKGVENIFWKPSYEKKKKRHFDQTPIFVVTVDYYNSF